MRNARQKVAALGMENIGTMNLINRALELAAKKFLQVRQTDPATQQFRMSRCLQCDRRDAEANRCKVCKCFLAVKTDTEENLNPDRLRYEITHCPLGNWDDLETANYYRKIDGLPLLTEPYLKKINHD